jgi:hypothetical protein
VFFLFYYFDFLGILESSGLTHIFKISKSEDFKADYFEQGHEWKSNFISYIFGGISR